MAKDDVIKFATPVSHITSDKITDKSARESYEYMRLERKKIYQSTASKKERGHQMLMSIMRQAEITDTEEEFERLTDEIDELADMRFITKAAAQEAQEEIDDKIYRLSISQDK